MSFLTYCNSFVIRDRCIIGQCTMNGYNGCTTRMSMSDKYIEMHWFLLLMSVLRVFLREMIFFNFSNVF